MREIKFRGKRKGNGEWVYGYLCENVFDEVMIQVITITQLQRMHDTFAVIPETVGQFTGLKDKSGKEIYEGDIVKFHYFYQSLGEGLGVEEAEHELKGNVEWGIYGWGINAIKGEHWNGYTGYNDGEGDCSFMELHELNPGSPHEESFEVIGNVHEVNPSADSPTLNTMNNFDPKEGQEATQAAGQEAATESAAQDTAMEVQDSEEGSTEG